MIPALNSSQNPHLDRVDLRALKPSSQRRWSGNAPPLCLTINLEVSENYRSHLGPHATDPETFSLKDRSTQPSKTGLKQVPPDEFIRRMYSLHLPCTYDRRSLPPIQVPNQTCGLQAAHGCCSCVNSGKTSSGKCRCRARTYGLNAITEACETFQANRSSVYLSEAHLTQRASMKSMTHASTPICTGRTAGHHNGKGLRMIL